ncbi:PepSY domain-containing protein [Streptosporangium subroseum]|uniref:PepSY domain-containing protein n=2 Tax=Streptosporangium TaxID=2000 RepID=UPI000D7DDE01|nr:peptidase [Streptosporangium sp. 'caverna']WSA15074.1 PepSY domain-containing protein [Streptosporangium subroseum]
MKQITRMTIATLGTAALLAGSGGIALAAQQTATITSAAGTVTATAAAAPAGAATISYSRALQIAKKRVPGARVTKAEREVEHGYRTWKFELRKGGREYEVYVSTKTGKIIKFKSGRDDSGHHGGGRHSGGHDDSGHHG